MKNFCLPKGTTESNPEYKGNHRFISENSGYSFGRNFFTNCVIPFWNNLPFDVERIRRVSNFQENTHTHNIEGNPIAYNKHPNTLI